MYTEMTIKTEDTDAAGGSKVIGAEVGAKKLDGSSTGKGTTSSGDLGAMAYPSKALKR